MKTIFKIQLELRISKDEAGNDRFTKKEIVGCIKNQSVETFLNDNVLLLISKNDQKIIAQIEKVGTSD